MAVLEQDLSKVSWWWLPGYTGVDKSLMGQGIHASTPAPGACVGVETGAGIPRNDMNDGSKCAGLAQTPFGGQVGRGFAASSAGGAGGSATQGYIGRPMEDFNPLNEAQRLIKADEEHRSLRADQALMLQMVMPYAGKALGQLQQGIYKWNKHQGFWGSGQIHTDEQARMKKAEKIALMHSELSEALEAIRNGISEGEKGCESEELADVLVRLLDYCGGFNIDLAQAFHRKQLKNLDRPFKHGKEF